ncbi:MAG: translesion error-prone DNA polymerase V autoproteolytic subunit [Fusobacteria bacterium]|nr:translesion error-prone DNA polymerase V autoproteolytic subunit [Fusobacteriota bacterium]
MNEKIEKELFIASIKKSVLIPILEVKIPAGFPSPADDFIEGKLDLNNIVIKNPTATFYMRVQGDSMKDANIHDGDLIVVDRSIEPIHGKIVIAVIDGEFTVKTLYKKNGILKLIPQNNEFREIIIKEENELYIWGCVSFVVHKL